MISCGARLAPFDMGYSEKTADVRIAQYEKNARTPNAETTAKLAEVLKVSPVVFSPTICASREDLFYYDHEVKRGGTGKGGVMYGEKTYTTPFYRR